jgi:Bacterial PH domain
VVIKISPMAHIAVGFLTLGLLIPVLAWPPSAPLLVIPVVLSAMIVRLRTIADDLGVTLRFHRGAWARARLKSGAELRLPAVTFATLPLLTEASSGRVPNPYR